MKQCVIFCAAGFDGLLETGSGWITPLPTTRPCNTWQTGEPGAC